MTTTNQTEKNIIAFGKALRDCNRMPVMPEENIIEIRRITGKDDVERELIIVDKLATRHVYGWENVSNEVAKANKGTWEIAPARGKLVNDGKGGTFVNGKRSLRSISASLRRGYGIKRGIVTDRKSYRYDV